MRAWLGRHKLWLILVTAVALVAIGIAVRNAQPPEVSVAEAAVGELTIRIAASGLVEAESTDLSFEGSGRLTDLKVNEGKAVSESDVLAWLEPITSPTASFPQTRSPSTTSTLGRTDVLQAPYEGTVVEVYVRLGTVVAAGQPVLRIVSAEPPWVTAFIESEDAVHLRPGQTLHCRAGGYLSEAWDIVVRSVGKEAVPRRGLMGSSRQVRVRCDVASGRFPLAPGTEVDIDGDIPLLTDALLIPTGAVVHEDGREWVWLVEGSEVRRRDVDIGPNNFDLIEVRSGLGEGDRVVVRGKGGLTEGQRVHATPIPPLQTETAGSQ